MRAMYYEKGGVWYDARTGLPKEPSSKPLDFGTPDNPGQAPSGRANGKLTPREILGLQVATGDPKIAEKVTTRQEAEGIGLTFKTDKTSSSIQKFKKENIKETFMEAQKAASHIPADIAQKLKEGYRLQENPDGTFELAKPALPAAAKELIPNEPDGVEYVEEGKEVEGYDHTKPVVDMATLQIRAKEDAWRRNGIRKQKGSSM